MAKVIVAFKIFPSEASVDMAQLKANLTKGLPKFASIRGFVEEPIAFSLKALIAHVILPEDRSGGLDEVEKYLLDMDEVSQVETLMVHRI